MESNEAPLAVARRRVAEGEAHVKAQVARVEDLTQRGHDTTQAQATLAVFETTLRFMREDLAHLETTQAQQQPSTKTVGN